MGRLFEYNGERFALLDYDELTMREQADLQKLTGLRGVDLLDGVANHDVEVTMGVIYLSRRRANPAVELAEVEVTRMSEYKLVGDVADPPTETPEVAGTSGGDTSVISGPVMSTT